MKFWNWLKNDGSEREMRIGGVITSFPWDGDDVVPNEFKKELFDGDGDLTLWVNSPGGECFAAAEIYTALMEYKRGGKNRITVKVEALSASAAVLISMAGDVVMISPAAQFYVHNPWTFVMGYADDLRKTAGALDEMKESILNAYILKTKQTREVLSELMDGEKPMSALTALKYGFADEILYDDGSLEGGGPQNTEQDDKPWAQNRLTMLKLYGKIL
jgi:ATP-dependent Clp protease protease subunit